VGRRHEDPRRKGHGWVASDQRSSPIRGGKDEVVDALAVRVAAQRDFGRVNDNAVERHSKIDGSRFASGRGARRDPAAAKIERQCRVVAPPGHGRPGGAVGEARSRREDWAERRR